MVAGAARINSSTRPRPRPSAGSGPSRRPVASSAGRRLGSVRRPGAGRRLRLSLLPTGSEGSSSGIVLRLHGPRRRRPGHPGRSRLEAHPPVAGEVQLRPGVHVADRHVPGVARRSPGRNPTDTRDGMPATLAIVAIADGELFAVARAVARSGSSPVPGTAARQPFRAVLELAAAQEGLDGRRPGGRRVAPLGHLAGQIDQDSGRSSGITAVIVASAGVPTARRPGPPRSGRWRHSATVYSSSAELLRPATGVDHHQRVRVESPFAVGIEPAGGVRQGQVLRAEVEAPGSRSCRLSAAQPSGPGWRPAAALVSWIRTLLQPPALSSGQRGHPQIHPARASPSGTPAPPGRRAG